MILTGKERYSLISILPEKSDISTMLQVRTIAKKVEFSEEEQKQIVFKTVKDERSGEVKQYVNFDKVEDKDIEFTDNELIILSDRIRELEARKEITNDLLDVCLKIRKL